MHKHGCRHRSHRIQSGYSSIYTNASTVCLIHHRTGGNNLISKEVRHNHFIPCAKIPCHTNPCPPLRMGTATTIYDVTILETGEIK